MDKFVKAATAHLPNFFNIRANMKPRMGPLTFSPSPPGFRPMSIAIVHSTRQRPALKRKAIRVPCLKGDELLVPDQPADHVDVPGGADLVGRGHDLHARSMDGGRGVEELEITSSVCSGSLAHTRSPGVAMRAPMACFMVSWLVITSS